MRHDLPPHIARQPYRHATLVGPMVRFRGQPVDVGSSTPRYTLDPRYLACTDHHLACDCREAEQNEQINEYRDGYREITDVIAAAIEGHPTEVFIDGEERSDLECQCAGCKIARITRRGISYQHNIRQVRLYTATPNSPF